MALEKLAIALVQCNGNTERAAAYAEKRWGLHCPEYRSLLATDTEAGGVLVSTELAINFVRALKARSVVRRLGARSLPIRGGQQVVKVTAGAELSYIGESQNIPVTQQSLGLLSFVGRKLTALVPVSGSLMRHSPELLEPVVRDDLLQGVASVEDSQFLRGLGTEHTPRGLRHHAPAANVIPANATVTLDNTVTDLEKLMAAVEDKDVPMFRPGWTMAPRTRRYLMTLRDSNGNFAFKEELSQGRLFGHPAEATTGIPTNLGGGSDESEVYFADWSEVAIGDGPVVVDVADGVTYFESGEIQSGYSTDTHTVRVLAEHDVTARHEEAIAVLTGVTWGA